MSFSSFGAPRLSDYAIATMVLSAMRSTASRLGITLASMAEVKAVGGLKRLFNVSMHLLSYVSNGQEFWNNSISENHLDPIKITDVTNIYVTGAVERKGTRSSASLMLPSTSRMVATADSRFRDS